MGRQRKGLTHAQDSTSTWGKRLTIKAGLNNAAALSPFAPFTQSPDSEQWFRLVDVRAATDRPSQDSRDVCIYVTGRQAYDNNPRIVDNNGVPIVTPQVDQQEAHDGLFVRVETGRGGITSEETSVLPAHGLSLHIGADSARVSVGFFPSLTQWSQGGAGQFNGAMASGFEIKAGVATAGLYRDFIRQEYDITVPNGAGVAVASRFNIPPFARRFQFFSDAPGTFTFRWESSLGNALVNQPLSGVPYVDSPQPIPINAARLVITAPVGLSTNPSLLWEREA